MPAQRSAGKLPVVWKKSPLLKRELSEMAVESYGDAVLSAAALADALRDDIIWTDTLTMTNRTQWPVFLCLRGVIVCRIAGANKQNSLSVTAGKGSNLWARSFGMHESSRLNMSFKCPS